MHNRALPAWWIVFGLVAGASRLAAADAVVGAGTPASCTEAALDAALLAVTTGGGTLTFSCGPAPHTILVAGEKLVFGEVTLDGGGRITLSGGLGTRILHVLSGSVVFAEGIVFTRGFSGAGPGGAIFVDGTGAVGDTRLSLHASTVRDSLSGAWGGGIAAANATLSLVASAVSGNEAAGGGGGINLNGGLLQLVGSEIAGNRSGGDGGGVEFWTGELYVEDSSIVHNVAENLSDTTVGGGLSLRGLFPATVSRSRISDNRSEFAGGGLNAAFGSSVTLTETELFDNQAVAGVGGGLRVAADAELEATATTLAGNRAVQGGGIDSAGALVVSNATISANIATGGVGGGISSDGDLRLTHVTVAGNLATLGGGLWSGGTGGSSTEIKNVLFSGNSASTGSDSCHFDQAPNLLQFSLWPDASCGTATTSGNRPNTTVTLPPLAFHCALSPGQEVTRTHVLPPGSLAEDLGSCVLPQFGIDQRQVARPQGAGCDIGAVEALPEPSCNGLFRDGFEAATAYRWSAAIP